MVLTKQKVSISLFIINVALLLWLYTVTCEYGLAFYLLRTTPDNYSGLFTIRAAGGLMVLC